MSVETRGVDTRPESTHPVAYQRSAVGVRALASRFMATRFPWRPALAAGRLSLDSHFGIEVARCYDAAADGPADPLLERSYAALRRETLAQHAALREGGFEVRPWLGRGQPYVSATDLRTRVPRERAVYVYLTRCGHGPGRAQAATHPMCRQSPVTVDGERLSYNDLFRGVHDVFGHVMHGNDFTVAGEFHATHDHLQMFSHEAQRALFAETIGQICWFYYGSHLRDGDGHLPRVGDDGYVPPRHRPYPEQKLVLLEDRLLRDFRHLFSDGKD